MKFEWDPRKDAADRRKHGIGFREATTVFGDPLATTFPDTDHSISEQRFLTIGVSVGGHLLVVAHTEMKKARESSARERLRAAKKNSMKRTVERRDRAAMRAEYDFPSMKGGVRGKHLEEYRKGTNVVLLKPDVAEAFPTEDAVNEALRGILTTTRAVRRIGGLAERTLQSAPGGTKHRRTSSRSTVAPAKDRPPLEALERSWGSLQHC